MYTNNKISKAVRLAIAFGAASATAFTASVNAAEEEEVAKVERIEVTGSRLRSTDLQGFSPVQVIDASDIDTSSVANIQELLLKNPAFGAPAISRTNSNFSTASAGVSTVDLRNLGTARTLVLVNGRRYVTGVPGSMAVDLNTIPAQFIERIEIMTGGASAVYGSDAVAGVVNIILKKDFEGIEFEAQYGESAEGDSEETQIQFTTGVTSANGKGNVMIHGSYTDQGAVFSKDRERSAVDQASTGAFFTGAPEDFFTATRPFFSSYAPQGRFFTGDTQYTYNSAGELVEGWSTNGSDTVEANGFNRSAFRTIAIPTERYLLAGKGSYEFTDGWTSFIEGTYASSQTTTQLEPFPFDTESLYQNSGGQMPIEFETFVPTDVDGMFERIVTVNPLVPQPIVDAATDTDGDGLRDIFFSRRLADVANRGNVADRDTFRLVTGVEGEIADGVYFDAYLGYGQTKESQVSSGQVNVLNFRSALEVIPDGNGGVMCRDATARAQGCVPANVYGANTLSPEAVTYIAAPGLLATFASQKYAGFNVSGEVFELPAGFVGIAAGMEYREEFSRSEFDPLQQAGLNAGNAIPRTEGEFDVTEFYTEVNVPLLADVFMADQLNLRGAVRLSDYSTVGNTTSWNVALDWAPIPELRFRAIRAESVRAPNVDELFSPPSQTFPSGLTDPCTGITNASTGAVAEACRAAPGVQANIDANGSFTLTQPDQQGISGFNRGNPDLDAETGKSWTFGFTFSPEGVLGDFDFNVDYFDIEIEDAIVGTPRQFILDQCYGGGNAALCNFITRRPTAQGANSAGSIEFIDSGVTNSGGFGTEGVDVVVTYGKNLEDFDLAGRLNARLSYTRLLDGYAIPLVGSDKDPFAGEVGAAEDKFYLTLGYAIGDFNIAWNTTFIGHSYLDDQFLAGYELAPESVGVGASTYHDINIAYKPSDSYEVFVGVNNAFDKEPRPILTGVSGNDTGTETAAGVYDPIGRRFYAGVRMKF